MKKAFLLFLSIVFVGSVAMAQKAPASPTVVSESANVKVSYGQPSKKDREIFGKLVPYGEVWRTGANSGTEVTFNKDVMLGNKKVAAGTYTLFTIPTATEWTIILNSELKQWGSYGYDKIKAKNLAEIKVKPMMGSEVVEKLTLTAQENQIIIAWDKVMVHVPISSIGQ
jgi:Protein of unknown function (DUF2911)